MSLRVMHQKIMM